jgi:hypothetical protein
MKRMAVAISALVLSGTLALAQSSGSGGGAAGGGSVGGGTSGAPQSSGGLTGPSITAPNGLTTPSPADPATTGRGPGVNPSNPQDMINRSNPQDLNRPGGSNPQSQVAPGVPNIVAPER